jgi:putative selenium metabolism hydrolase
MAEGLARKILEAARVEKDNVTEILRALIRIPSPSCGEGEVAAYVRAEMEKLDIDEVFTDSMGSIVGRYGKGGRVLLYDSHMDTVGIGNPDAWSGDPYEAKLSDGVVFGRGASDNKAGLACTIGALRVLSTVREQGDFSLYVAGVEEHGIVPECVVLSECTDLGVYRGHRGRAEIEIVTRGRSAHGSAPERGENALYKMAPVIEAVKFMNGNLREDAFLGRASIAATRIECETPSVNAIPDMCRVSVDRRTVPGETVDGVTRELDEAVRAVNGEVRLKTFSSPSYKGYVKERSKFFPAWALDEKAHAVQSAGRTYRMLFEEDARTDRWLFSTDGNYSMGVKSIPTIGFGPGEERHAHTVEDQVRVEDLWKAVAFYALFPFVYCGDTR